MSYTVVVPATKEEAKALIEALTEWAMNHPRQAERDKRGGFILGELADARAKAWRERNT